MLFDDEGKQINPNLTNYIMPTSLDMPEVNVDIVENFDPTGPFGAKGVGEPTAVPTAATICNAIHDAVGVRVTSLPATAEKVLKLIKKSERDQATGAYPIIATWIVLVISGQDKGYGNGFCRNHFCPCSGPVD